MPGLGDFCLVIFLPLFERFLPLLCEPSLVFVDFRERFALLPEEDPFDFLELDDEHERGESAGFWPEAP